ncbi:MULTISPECIES: VirB4 family type IV secretion/conjugal transfer ATPase [unclassified Rhodanobacter]|uniref:VirB4 family type IV secretion/conjugal transfer ATPase n=1 Tax=Rhodanobacter humi TaxID=1888173 RepID=A0ABV4AVE7_9GAMM
MSALPKYFNQVNGERASAPFIPFSAHVSPNTIITKDGDFMRIWKVGGVTHESADPADVQLRMDGLNTMLRSIGKDGDHVAIWTHQVRRKTSDRLVAAFENAFCKGLDDKYYDSLAGYRMMANELYLTLVYRPAPSRAERSLVKASRRSLDQILQDQRVALRKLDDLAFQVEAQMRKYDLNELTCYDDPKAGTCSEMLTFLHFLLTGQWQKVRLPRVPLDEYLGNAQIFAGTETIELRTPVRSRYAQGMDFLDYTAGTEPGFLNDLMYQDYEYVLTQSFSFKSKVDAQKALEKQQKQLQNTEDGSAQQMMEISVAVDQLIQGEFVMGEYHFTLLVFGDTVDEVRENITSAMAICSERGFTPALVNIATEAAFWAQLPCNWFYRPRVPLITSKNFAGLSSFHNFLSGKRDGNPWGQAVSLLKTPSGQPLYMNFHYAKGDEDAFDKKLLGNTRIIGQSGAGKTVLMNFLLCQAQKFKYKAPKGYTDVFFDKDRGAELAVRAIGGKYLAIKNGEPTGFNPFQMESTPENLGFLEELVKFLVTRDGSRISAVDDQRISEAVKTVMAMPKSLRRLSIVLQNITEGTSKEERENSVVRRLAKWCVDDGYGKRGALWWVLDNVEDKIDFTTHTSYGFDGTDFLDNADVRTPISMYLLHRMETVIDGRRFIYFMDEAWKWVDDPAFSEFAGNKQLTIRKQNGLGVFATQMPSSLLKSPIAAQLVQQVATEIYLPNPKADFHEYTEGFKVTEAEFEIIKSLGEESRMFLVKQGHNSALAHLDLSPTRDEDGKVIVDFDDELSILSGSSDNIEMLDQILSEVGEDPDRWVPVFHERRKARRANSKS